MWKRSCAGFPWNKERRSNKRREMLNLFGTVVIAGIVGYASERSGFTHNVN